MDLQSNLVLFWLNCRMTEEEQQLQLSRNCHKSQPLTRDTKKQFSRRSCWAMKFHLQIKSNHLINELKYNRIDYLFEIKKYSFVKMYLDTDRDTNFLKHVQIQKFLISSRIMFWNKNYSMFYYKQSLLKILKLYNTT